MDRRPDAASALDQEEGAPESPRPTGGRLTRVAAGIVVGGVALWLSFRGFQLDDLFDSFARLSIPFTGAALLSTLLTLVAVSWRWQWLFHPRQREVPFPALFKAIVVGQMLNILSPLRVGEIARVYSLAQDGGLSKAHVLATVALEKVLDLVVFAAAVALLLALMALPDGVRLKTSAQLSAAFGALAFLWMAARFGLPLARRAERLMPSLPIRWRDLASRTVHRFLDGLAALRRPYVGSVLLAQSVLVMFLSALTNLLVIEAFGFDVPIWTALFLLILLQVGSVPPSLPGKLGVFNYLVVVGLSVFGVSRADAFSYSVVLYAVAFLPKLLLGACYVALTPISRGRASAA